MTAPFVSAGDLLPGWKADVLSGRPPPRYALGDAFGSVKLGPGRVVVVGGPPGTGKTALALQWTTDALRQAEGLSALVVNVEMPPPALLERVLARLSGVPLELIQERQLDSAVHGERLAVGFATLEAFAPRLHFLTPPFDWRTVATAMDGSRPGLLVLDYLQRIGPPEKTESERAAVSASMAIARRAADAGVAVLALSAVSRPGQGQYAGLGLGSFRESSEIEFACDDAFILAPEDGGEDEGDLVLRHLKARYGRRQDVPLRFRGDVMSFDAREAEPESAPADGGGDAMRDQIRAAWASADAQRNGEPHADG